MRELADPPSIQTTPDGFSLCEGSERVSPDDFPEVAPLELVMPVISEALKSAAAEDGSLLKFDVRAFYQEHVAAAIGIASGDPPLRYDAFVSMTLREAFMWLEDRGYLAHRGNGDSYDYWLARPAVRPS